MITIRRTTCALVLALLAETASGQARREADTTAAQIQAEAAAADFSMTLRQTLMKAIQDGGPIEGVNACQVQAPIIANDIGQFHGVSIGRVGVRVRNGGNAAVGWQRDTLAAFERRAAAGESPESFQQIALSPGGETLRFARGIRTEGTCLMCHGPDVPPQIEASIRRLYPEDRATGFSEGSLRGLLWVEVPVRRLPEVVADARAAVPLSPGQSSALRSDMRRQLEALQVALAGLADQDWTRVIEATTPAAAAPHGDGTQGSDYRRRLPPSWFRLSKPMHQNLQLAAEEAGGEKRVHVIAGHLANATAQCTACHASFRISEKPRATSPPAE